jgi:hypothetical protein
MHLGPFVHLVVLCTSGNVNAYCAESTEQFRTQMEQRPYSGPTVQQQGLPADTRQASVHLCGFDISGVSIAGQVGVQRCASSGNSNCV